MIAEMETGRLLLGPYVMTDAPRAGQLGDDSAIAATTFLPHPYTLDKVEAWIRTHPSLIKKGEAYPLAIVLKTEMQLIGTMTLRVDKVHEKGELAYWIGRDYWGKGFATEAAERMIEFGFAALKLNRIWAPVMSRNKASGKVMEKAGLTYEGTLKEDVLKRGVYEDVDIYGLLKRNYVSK